MAFETAVTYLVVGIFAAFPFIGNHLFRFSAWLQALEQEERQAWQDIGQPAAGFLDTSNDLAVQWRSIQFLYRREYEELASPAVRETGRRARDASRLAAAALTGVVVVVILVFLQVDYT